MPIWDLQIQLLSLSAFHLSTKGHAHCWASRTTSKPTLDSQLDKQSFWKLSTHQWEEWICKLYKETRLKFQIHILPQCPAHENILIKYKITRNSVQHQWTNTNTVRNRPLFKECMGRLMGFYYSLKYFECLCCILLGRVIQWKGWFGECVGWQGSQWTKL